MVFRTEEIWMYTFRMMVILIVCLTGEALNKAHAGIHDSMSKALIKYREIMPEMYSFID
jgi:hypothetical protein